MNSVASEPKKVKYPENLKLKARVHETGRPIRWYQKKIGCSYEVLNRMLNGHYKGVNIAPKLEALLSQ